MCLIVKLMIIAVLVSLGAGVAIARGIVIDAVGDLMLAGPGAPAYSERGYGYPFAAKASNDIAGR